MINFLGHDDEVNLQWRHYVDKFSALSLWGEFLRQKSVIGRLGVFFLVFSSYSSIGVSGDLRRHDAHVTLILCCVICDVGSYCDEYKISKYQLEEELVYSI